jgi:outer membrane protein OmpA-like peptidoglycan-associated protein/peptidoglycan hydrolase-like protein with peptidoglycan-binding domain
MPVKPILDDLELEQVQKVEAEEQESVTQHDVPALEGDFLQDLGRRAVRITLNGVLTGPDAGDGLKQLREKFQNTQPVSFVTDIATATSVGQVLIEALDIREVAGKPERFEYGIAIREFIPPPPPEVTPPPPTPDPPKPQLVKSTLEVEVIVDGQPNFDFTAVTVTIDGTQSDGTQLSRTLTNRTANVWTDADMPAGQYAAKAVVSVPQAMSGTANATLQAGQTTRVTIRLTPGVAIAQVFIVHFAIDKAFIEPCMRPVLRNVADFAKNNPTSKLLILGNTDLVGTPGAPTGSDPYNQSLSERRARSVFAYITFGLDAAGALAEWQELRKAQKVGHPTINDNWGLTQVQYMLQDLGFYPGGIDGQDGPLTREAIRAFRCHVGLPPGNTMDDPTWEALLQAYLGQDQLAVPAGQFFPNCGGEILKWTGCASQDPVKNVRTAWRPNRRVELIFAHVNSLPCTIPQPDTFNLPAAGAVNSSWCVGPGDVSHRACFVVPHLPPGGQPQGSEWLRQPAQPGTLTVQGTITFDDGRPFAQGRFVLIAPDGTNKADEQPTGQPVPGRTDANGGFQFPDLPVGIYSLEVHNTTDVLVRLQEAAASTAKGPSVCKFLQSDTDHLDVVILADPVLREIQLPVVAHLMTALHPLTHAVRTCAAAVGPRQRQATAHTDDEIRAAFVTANDIWKQARVSFQLTDIVHEAYSFKTECEIDDTELSILFDRVNYGDPNVVNVYFVGDLAGTSEAGGSISVESGASQGVAPGCAIGDRFQFTALGLPIDTPLNADQLAQVLAHELGHYVNLGHADAAATGRLMLPGTAAGDNRTLTADEVKQARASQGANDDCVLLTLKVTGATRVGGTLTNRFLVVQGTAGPVTVDAQIPARMLDPSIGTLVMTGGDPGATNQQRTVSTATNATVDVVATYTPAGGGQPITRHAVVLVSNFQLQVNGATQVGGANSTTFLFTGGSSQPVIVTAALDPAPFAIPSDLIVWGPGGIRIDDPQRQAVDVSVAAETVVSATVAGVTRQVTIRVVLVQAIATAVAGAPALTFVRFGIWDNAYDPGGNVNNNAADANNFIGSDKRKFHLRVSDPTAAGTRVSLNWKTLTAGGGDDDAPASQVLTLTELTPGSKVFVSKAVMLVTDDTDRNFPTHSGFTAPDPDAGLRNSGQSNHRTRRAKIDGSIRAEYSPAGGGTVGLTLPLFNRASLFLTRDSVDNVPAGAATLTPAAMSGVTGGVRWTIKVGSSLNLDSGDNQETVLVTAVTATTFNAVLTKAHNGTATPFPIVGFADERRRVSTRVVRYTNPAFPHLIAATDAYIADQFQRANLRWNQVGIQFDSQATENRVFPAGAVDPTGVYGGTSVPVDPPLRIVLADLIPGSPDTTLTVVFVSLSVANAYTALFNQTGIPVPAGGTVDMNDRLFIFINPSLGPEETTLAHECHHALFNRGDAVLGQQYFTFNTKPPSGFGIPLPDVRVYRRILKRHTADPDNDPNDDNIINWARRLQTVRFPAKHDFDPAPDATTGNKFTQDF